VTTISPNVLEYMHSKRPLNNIAESEQRRPSLANLETNASPSQPGVPPTTRTSFPNRSGIGPESSVARADPRARQRPESPARKCWPQHPCEAIAIASPTKTARRFFRVAQTRLAIDRIRDQPLIEEWVAKARSWQDYGPRPHNRPPPLIGTTTIGPPQLPPL